VKVLPMHVFTPAEIGARLRKYRLDQGVTITDLAAGAGLSVGFISLVENGKSDLTIGRLSRFLEYFSVNLTDFLKDDDGEQLALEAEDFHVHEKERILTSPMEGVTYRLVPQPSDGQFTVMEVTLEPGAARSEVSSHEGDECVYVLQGQMQLHYGSRTQSLKAGDSQYFDGLLPHSFNNPTKRTTRFLAVMGNLRDSRSGERPGTSVHRPLIPGVLGTQQPTLPSLDEHAAASDQTNSNQA
jgi:transcriptional regulator with XRE-family HTH domain